MNHFLTVTLNDTIKTALERINENCKTAVAVVDESLNLLRLLTDGDLRRAILDGFNTSDKLSTLSTSVTPFTVPEGISYTEILALLDEKEFDHAVVVSNDGKFLDLLHRRELTRVWLSSPHIGRLETKYVNEAFDTNWIAPLGPNVDGFERELAEYVGVNHAVALSSGTAAIHLSLILLGVRPKDLVLCSALTFVASANPILYQYATPVFIDSDLDTWNMCPKSLSKALASLKGRGQKPKAIIVVNLYGQVAKMNEINALASEYDIPVIEDAAESLGATYKEKQSGTLCELGIFSFNGNKIITTSGGGMLVSNNKELIDKARHLATQARENYPFYHHAEVGFNYRMSNVLAGIGRGQLKVLPQRVSRRREIYNRYLEGLADIECLVWMPELENTKSNRWLTAAILEPSKTTVSPAELIEKLSFVNIEARHIWKPMQLQPLFDGCEYISYESQNVSEYLFNYGVCLPSSSNMTDAELDRIIKAIRQVLLTS